MAAGRVIEQPVRSHFGESAIATVLAVLWLGRLVPQAARGTFCSDECFHAAAMHALRATQALPRELPEFYSGFRYFYHPAFHVLGALWLACFGEAGLHLLPVAVTAATLALLLSGAATGSRRSGAWAALAMMSVASYGDYAVRLYADGFVVFLFVAVAAAWRTFRFAPTTGRALSLGALAGIALLAKFTSMLWLALFAVSVVVALVRRDRALAQGLALAAVVALSIALPWWWRNQLLFGSAFYPAGAPDVDHALQALNAHRYSDPPLALLASCVHEAWAVCWLGALALMTLPAAAPADRPGHLSLLLGAVLAIMASVFGPYAALRHLDAFVAVLAVAAAMRLESGVPRDGGRTVRFTGGLLVFLGLVALFPRDHRADQEPPAELGPALAAVRQFTPTNARILSLWTYDTAYRTGRQATWPIPWGQEGHPVRLFRATDSQAFAEAMDAERIGWLLIPTEADSGAFDSANHPADFMAHVDTLVAHGALREAWSSDDLRLLGRTGAH
jgi:hypothetical protein